MCLKKEISIFINFGDFFLEIQCEVPYFIIKSGLLLLLPTYRSVSWRHVLETLKFGTQILKFLNNLI